MTNMTQDPEKSHEICGNPNCTTCSRWIRFEMPPDIPQALADSRLVLFAGAGVSTEARGVFPSTFYEDIAAEIQVEAKDLSFPALMTRFSERHGRRELLVRIKQRFDYLDAFPEVYGASSRFHRAISTIPFLEQIYTTNWDELFEAECSATPFVHGEDFAFWDLPGRKVFKLHGSISNYGSVVATESDYESCEKRLRSGLIGSSLKLALATRTIVFMGYSVRDPDFLQVLQLVKDEVGETAPPMYAVTINDSDRSRLESLGLRVIVTDATFFIEELKRELVAGETMLDDSWLHDVSELLEEAIEAHIEIGEKFKSVEHPALVYTFCYQDGLKHGLAWLLSRASAGECSHPCHLIGNVQAYKKILKEKRRAKNYFGVAYVEGYINALLVPLVEEEERFNLPIFYLLGSKEDIPDIESLAELLPSSDTLHRAGFKQAKKALARAGSDQEIIFHHPPVL